MPKKRTRRRVLQLTGTALTAAVGGCASVTDKFSDDAEQTTTSNTQTIATQTTEADENESQTTGTPEPVEIQPASGPIPKAPVPGSPGKHQYAVMGNADATATVYGNWKCPHTKNFVNNLLPDIVTEYVEPGKLQVKFRALAYRSDEPFLGPDAPRAARAGLAVWNADPHSYWQYFASVFANQPDEDREWATTELLTRFAASANVQNQSQVTQKIGGNAYANLVNTTTTAASDANVYSVPRVVVDGTVTAPTVDFEATKEQLDEATKS